MGRAVGLKGEVEVLVLSDAPGRFSVGAAFHHNTRTLVIRSVRLQGERTVVAFEGVRDRNGAEELKGAELTISADDARALDDAEYWDHDLVGCEVVTASGEPVGTVSDVLHTPANSVLVVKGDREHLIPLVKDVVRRIEPSVRITIDPIPGLLGEA